MIKDKRVLEKEKRVKEEEENVQKKVQESKAKKIEENTIKLEKIKNELKKRKQKKKDAKKKIKKKVNVAKIGLKEEVVDTIPNIREVPKNCEHLVEKDDVLYLVPGDGCCGPNCASAFLFKDEVYGPSLRKQMNAFFADHWYDKYQYITQCSEDDPFIRKLGGGGEIRFTDPAELLKYFKSLKASSYIWSDSEDLAIIADMYQINIKVITTKGIMDKNPSVNWIRPDNNLKKFAVLQNVELDDMILLHENDVHFNLVISKDSDLAKLGSLSYRFNIGPLAKETDTEDSIVEKDVVTEENDSSIDVKKMKDILKKLRESEVNKKAILSEYLKCERELRLKTEETVKLKTEINDLKEIMKLSEELKDQDVEITPDSKNDSNDMINESVNVRLMKKAGFRRNSPLVQPSPVKPAKRDKEFNCKECSFQGTTQIELSKHNNLKHKIINDENVIRCRTCGEIFSAKWNLMNHRKSMHLETVALCRNYNVEKCPYAEDICWWNHSKERSIKCFICNETFASKMLLMRHRKKDHTQLVKTCNNFSQNNCRFQNDDCWYIHNSENVAEPMPPKCNDGGNVKTVFQKVSEDLDPPIQNCEKKRKKPGQEL